MTAFADVPVSTKMYRVAEIYTEEKISPIDTKMYQVRSVYDAP